MVGAKPPAALLARRLRERRLASARATCSRSWARPASGSRGSAAEFLTSVGDATVVRGRCLSYGEGITYWPVVEVLKQLRPRPAVDPTSWPPTDQRLARRTRRPSTSSRGDRLGVPKAAGGGAAENGRSSVVFDDVALGRGDVPRPGRARGRSQPRRADPPALHRPSRAARSQAGLGRRQDERDHRPAGGAVRRRDGRADRVAARRDLDRGRRCAAGSR